MDEVKRFVGIDVAKAQLEVFIRPGWETFSVANDEVGIGELLRQLVPADFVRMRNCSRSDRLTVRSRYRAALQRRTAPRNPKR
jgi:hypothetical protein